MSWTVRPHRSVAKALKKLPCSIREQVATLLREIEEYGPIRGTWPNYGKLGKNRHHCHLKKGQPTYVAVWEEIAGQIRLVEVTYVGTHAKAPY